MRLPICDEPVLKKKTLKFWTAYYLFFQKTACDKKLFLRQKAGGAKARKLASIVNFPLPKNDPKIFLLIESFGAKF